jgi:hypothetical protein
MFDDQRISNWPEHMSNEDCELEYQNAIKRGKLDNLYREFRNLPIAIEDQGFKPEYWQYYNDSKSKDCLTEEQINNDNNYETVILADPARTMKTGSCLTAVSAVSINLKTQQWLVRDVQTGKFNPDEIQDKMFEMAAQYNALVLAPEVTGLNEYIMYPLKNEMQKRGKSYIIIEVSPREGKTGPKRSAGLIPLYRQRHIWHNINTCGHLETMLLQWPRPSSWDAIDTISSMLFVLEKGDRYFTAYNEYPGVDEYAGLDYEPATEQEYLV